MKLKQFRKSITALLIISTLFIACNTSSGGGSNPVDEITITGVKIEGEATISATGSTTLIAIPKFSGSENISNVTYDWVISEGTEYATISSSNDTAVLTGKT